MRNVIFSVIFAQSKILNQIYLFVQFPLKSMGKTQNLNMHPDINVFSELREAPAFLQVQGSHSFTGPQSASLLKHGH